MGNNREVNMSSSFEFRLHNLTATERLGRIIAETVPDGSTIGFTGTLGAGKTRLIQAIASGCGVSDGIATSPTFVLCQVYQGNRTIYHLDAYRLSDADEFLELGVEELFDQPALTVVEWADLVANDLPSERMTVHLEILDRDSRLATLSGSRDYQPILSEIGCRWAVDTS